VESTPNGKPNWNKCARGFMQTLPHFDCIVFSVCANKSRHQSIKPPAHCAYPQKTIDPEN
jgi:hypothetical protein